MIVQVTQVIGCKIPITDLFTFFDLKQNEEYEEYEEYAHEYDGKILDEEKNILLYKLNNEDEEEKHMIVGISVLQKSTHENDSENIVNISIKEINKVTTVMEKWLKEKGIEQEVEMFTVTFERY